MLKSCARLEPLFPQYMFLHIDCQTNEYLESRSAPGVSHFLCADGTPVALPAGLVEEIRHRVERENGLGPVVRFAAGDPVVITAGPFRDLEAVFQHTLTPQGRCLVLLHILGQFTRVQIDASFLAKARQCAVAK
jgi:transcriptional antiterminator RfaH